jgi:hypothetical protein
MRRLVLLVTLLSVLPLNTAVAAVCHSGRIVALSCDGQTITMEEMGVWTSLGNRTTREVVHPTRGATLTLVTRAFVPARATEPLATQPVQAIDLSVHDYATATIERRGDQLMAAAVEIVRPTESLTFQMPATAATHGEGAYHASHAK